MGERVCRNCGVEIVQKRLRRGYIDQCDSCSDGDQLRYIGRVANDNKGGEITIFRTNIESVQAQLSAEARAGFRPCLPVGSPLITQAEVCEKARDARQKK